MNTLALARTDTHVLTRAHAIMPQRVTGGAKLSRPAGEVEPLSSPFLCRVSDGWIKLQVTTVIRAGRVGVEVGLV